jgi:ATP-binding cassette subfamily F protein 3
MRHALNVALQSFAGGMLIVSHDRHLIKAVADSLWLVADGRLSVFDGDLDDYQQWLRSRGKVTAVKPAAKAASSAPQPRGRLTALRREIAEIERRIAENAAQLARVEEALCKDPMHAALQAEHAQLTRDAGTIESRWMEVGTAIEAAEAQLGDSR